MPPRELVPIDTSYREVPSVAVLEQGNPINLEYAEPSPVMGFFSRLWNRIIFLFKATLVLLALGTYPALTISAHKVDDSRIEFANGYEWSVGEIGGTVTLIARILEGPGWAGNQPKWHPQARLTAMPAWQEAIAASTSDYTRLIAVQTGNEDVAAAARLLAPEGASMNDRLTAAAEILARYDSNVENGHAVSSSGERALVGKLNLTIGWANDSRSTLAIQARDTTTWPASYENIETFYTAKARAHVAHELLNAALHSESEVVTARGLTKAKTDALDLWRRAATQKPLFVANLSGSDSLLGNHLTNMALLMDEASAATRVLAEALDQPIREPEIAKSAELSANMPPSP